MQVVQVQDVVMGAKQPRVKVEKYTVNQFNEQFPDDAACLADIFRRRYPNGLTCERCQRENKFTPIAGRRAYSCVCGFQVYPTAASSSTTTSSPKASKKSAPAAW